MYKIFIKYYGELIDEVSGVDGAGDCQEEYELGEEYIVESVRLLEKKIKELLQNATSNLLGNPFVVDEETELPETFNVPNLSTGQTNTKYIIRAK